MAEYRICNNCDKVVRLIKKYEFSGGNEIIIYVCPECGHEKKTTINRVHYGNDAIHK